MKKLNPYHFLLIILVFLFIQSGCSSAYSLKGELAGIPVDTEVDSELVQRVYDNSKGESELFSCPENYQLPTQVRLREVTEMYSADVATLVLTRCLERIPKNKVSQQVFLQEVALVRASGNSEGIKHQTYLDSRADQYLVLFMPGWDYKTNGHLTGADLQTPRRIIDDAGFEGVIVPIPEAGSVKRNAQVLLNTLEQYEAMERHRHKQFIIVSASSAGPAVALALNDKGDHFPVVAWLNIGGVLRGAPVIDHLLPWTKSWLLKLACLFEGWNYSDLKSLSVNESKLRFEQIVLPSEVTIINYVGIPFSGDITPFAEKFYPILKKLGPNDGMTLIADALAPGYTILAIGSDHFVREDPEIDIKTAALLTTLIKLVERRLTVSELRRSYIRPPQ